MPLYKYYFEEDLSLSQGKSHDDLKVLISNCQGLLFSSAG